MPDDVQRALGRLEAGDEASQRQRAELFKQIGELREDMHQGFTEIRALMAPLAKMPQHIETHCKDLDSLNNYVQRIKGVMWAGRAVWVVVLALGGAGYALYKDHQTAAEQNAKSFGLVWSAINRIAPAK